MAYGIPIPAPILAARFTQADLVSAIITILVTSLFIFFAAKFVLGRSSFIASILTAILGSILAQLLAGLVGGPDWLGFVVAVAIWALVAAIFFRTAWIRGAIIGLVAWVLWIVVNLIIDAVGL